MGCLTHKGIKTKNELIVLRPFTFEFVGANFM
jgi:hypothetical protein